MAVRINTANDYLLAEDPETVLYASKTAEKPPDEAAWLSIDWVEVFPIKREFQVGDALLTVRDVTARFAKAELKGIAPKEGDLWNRLRDGSYWVVKVVETLSFGNEYRLHCQKSTKR